jgi:hypothetical protein
MALFATFMQVSYMKTTTFIVKISGDNLSQGDPSFTKYIFIISMLLGVESALNSMFKNVN